MAVTEPIRVQDVVHYELGGDMSREVLTVAASQTIALGQICELNANGQVQVLSAAVDEVQKVTISGTPLGGTFMLGFKGEWTTPIAYNAAASTVQSALQALGTIGANNATVTGNAGGPYTITFAGSLAGASQDLIEINPSGLTGDGDETGKVERITAGAAAGENAYCVALEAVTTGAGETQEAVFLVRDAVVRRAALTYGNGSQSVVDAALKVRGIIPRTGPTYTVQST